MPRLLIVCALLLVSAAAPADDTSPIRHRLRVNFGMALLQSGGGDWADTLWNAGYGDTHYNDGGWFSTPGYTDYPVKANRAELFLIDASYILTRSVGVGLAFNMNEPFDGWAGFKSTSPTNISGLYVYVTPSQLKTLSPQVFLLFEKHVSLTLGLGPAIHWTTLTYGDGPVSEFAPITDTKFGLMLRGSVEYPIGSVRLGVSAQYNWVGSEAITSEMLGDPEFPTSEFSLNYAFVGVHLGIGI